MAIMTEEEAEKLDELWTKTTPRVSGDGKSGLFMKHKGNIVILDDLSAAWLHARSGALRKTPSEIIGELVREKIAASM